MPPNSTRLTKHLRRQYLGLVETRGTLSSKGEATLQDLTLKFLYLSSLLSLLLSPLHTFCFEFQALIQRVCVSLCGVSMLNENLRAWEGQFKWKKTTWDRTINQNVWCLLAFKQIISSTSKRTTKTFCCSSLFILDKLLEVSLKTLIKHMVGNPLINVPQEKDIVATVSLN